MSFNPSDGWTIPHRFDAGVGEVIGECRTRRGAPLRRLGKKPEPVDFRTHQIVLDVAGGGFRTCPPD